MYRLSIDDPYLNPMRNKLVQLEKGYNLQSEDNYDYLPSNMMYGGAYLNDKKIMTTMMNLADKYNLHEHLQNHLQGKGVLKTLKKGAKFVYEHTVNNEAFMGTIHHMILDNEYIMTALKIGAVGAVTALLATIGAPASVVALAPLFISWTEIAIRDYLKRKKEIENRDRLEKLKVQMELEKEQHKKDKPDKKDKYKNIYGEGYSYDELNNMIL